MTDHGTGSAYNGHLAVFLATSGHSGVDRIMKNLLPFMANKGVRIDLLHIKNHGPYIQSDGKNLRVIDLSSSHAYSSIIPLYRYLKLTRPSVLLSDKDRVNRVAILATKMAGGKTRVVVRTGINVSMDLAQKDPFDRWLHRMSMRHLYTMANAVISPSMDAAEDLSQYVRGKPELVATVPNPVVTSELYSLAKETPRHPWLLEKNTPVIMGIGELCARKDFETLLRAFALVRRERKIRLLILGEGRRRDSLMDLARNLSIGEDVDMPGFIHNPYSYLARADLYVHSSRYEGFGVSLVEALALGIPCVSTNCPSGPREILDNGRFGPLVPVGDHSLMAEAMIKTLLDPLGSETLRNAAQRYTLEQSALHYLRVLGFQFNRDSVEAPDVMNRKDL